MDSGLDVNFASEAIWEHVQSVRNLSQVRSHQEIWEQLRLKDSKNKMMPVSVSLTVFFTIFGTIGVVGNILLLMVTTRRTAAKGINSCLIPVLASVDLTTCAIILPFTIIVDIWAVPVHDMTCKFLGILRATFVFLSMFTLGLIAAERVLLVCFVPSVVLSKTLLKRCVIIGLVAAITFSFPFGLRTGVYFTQAENETSSFYLNTNNDTIMTSNLKKSTSQSSANFGACHKDDRFISDQTFQVYVVVHFVFCVLFLVYLVVCYTGIFIFVWRHQRTRYRRWPGSKTVVSENLIESNVRNNSMLDPRERKSGNDVMIVLEPLTPVEEDQIVPVYPEPSSAMAKDSNNFGNTSKGREKKSRNSSVFEKAERRQPHVRVAYVLGAITFCFILAFAPYLLATTNVILSDSNIRWKRNARKFLVYLYFISAISNPVIYSSLGRVIITELKNIFHFNCFWKR